MNPRSLEAMTVPPTATLRDAMEAIDKGACEVCLVVDADSLLVGLLTDGDIRRALLAGSDLGQPALDHATRAPQVVTDSTTRAHVLDLMQSMSLAQVPIVDSRGRLTGLHTLSKLLGRAPLPNIAVIMAGGRGTRLGAVAQDKPKPLVPVAGRPVIDWVLLNLVGGGLSDIFVSVNHFADQIEEHLGDGVRYGSRIRYLREEPDLPLGTAGSLALLPAQAGQVEHPLVVVNADLISQFAVADLLQAHARNGAAITVATHTYEHEVPFGVLEVDDAGMVQGIGEKPTIRMPVSAGVYAIDPACLELVPRGRASTVPDLMARCIELDRGVGTWTMTSDWIDIGTPADLARARGQV